MHGVYSLGSRHLFKTSACILNLMCQLMSVHLNGWVDINWIQLTAGRSGKLKLLIIYAMIHPLQAACSMYWACLALRDKFKFSRRWIICLPCSWRLHEQSRERWFLSAWLCLKRMFWRRFVMVLLRTQAWTHMQSATRSETFCRWVFCRIS